MYLVVYNWKIYVQASNQNFGPLLFQKKKQLDHKEAWVRARWIFNKCGRASFSCVRSNDYWWVEGDGWTGAHAMMLRVDREPAGIGVLKSGRESGRRIRILLARLTTDDVREARLAACLTSPPQRWVCPGPWKRNPVQFFSRQNNKCGQACSLTGQTFTVKRTTTIIYEVFGVSSSTLLVP